MSIQTVSRPKWEIDRRLDYLLGENVRLLAQAFSTVNSNLEPSSPLVQVGSLILPDGSPIDHEPVYFEGKLISFRRDISVVFVILDSHKLDPHPPNGHVLFRGNRAAILQGPALVQLKHPLLVERLPADAETYWNDLKHPDMQLRLPLPPYE